MKEIKINLPLKELENAPFKKPYLNPVSEGKNNDIKI